MTPKLIPTPLCPSLLPHCDLWGFRINVPESIFFFLLCVFSVTLLPFPSHPSRCLKSHLQSQLQPQGEAS